MKKNVVRDVNTSLRYKLERPWTDFQLESSSVLVKHLNITLCSFKKIKCKLKKNVQSNFCTSRRKKGIAIVAKTVLGIHFLSLIVPSVVYIWINCPIFSWQKISVVLRRDGCVLVDVVWVLRVYRKCSLLLIQTKSKLLFTIFRMRQKEREREVEGII